LVPTKSMFACFMGSQPDVRLKTERAPQRLC
jgi:hypothetical protein